MADKRVKELKRKLQDQGWRIEPAKSGAFMAYSPDGKTIVNIHPTPGDYRWYANTIARLRKGGFKP